MPTYVMPHNLVHVIQENVQLYDMSLRLQNKVNKRFNFETSITWKPPDLD